jgi:putative glycosyltransferase (TIGR04372 family)
MTTETNTSLWPRNLSHIREEGWVAVHRKLGILIKLLSKLILTIPFIPVVLLVRIIRPLVLIRFGSLLSHVIGHFVFDAEYYLSEKELEGQKAFDLFFFAGTTEANKQWALMVRRHLRVHPIVRYLDNANRFIPGSHKHIIPIYPYSEGYLSRDTKDILFRTEPQIRFTEEENIRGRKFLKEVGIKENDYFVCLIARDSAYKSMVWSERDWTYHNYRDSDIDNYEQAATWVADSGYWVFRMGKAVHKPFLVNHPRIIDYASSKYRSDFLDIFLSANCRFFINGESGLVTTPAVFRVPILFVNLSAIEWVFSWNPNIISVPKKYWFIQKKRYMTFTEIFKSGAGKLLHTEQYEKLQIELIENTPEEIADATLEMHERLNGTWETNEEDEELQKRFWEMLPKSELHGEFRARIGTEFLRQNQELLD